MEKTFYIVGDRKVSPKGEDLGPAEGEQTTEVAQLEPAAQDPASELQGQLDALISERDSLKGTLESVTAELQVAKARVSELESTPVPVSEAPALPADARERLIEINGIGEKLADKVLEVLAAAPASAEQ